MSLYAMNSIDNRRAIREALAWRGTSYLEAANILNTSVEYVVKGMVGLWRIMEITGATEAQIYEWGHN